MELAVVGVAWASRAGGLGGVGPGGWGFFWLEVRLGESGDVSGIQRW